MIDKSVPASQATRDEWFASSYSNAGGNCLEVKVTRNAILLRDSKDRRADRPIIAVGSAAWRTFLDAVTSD